MTYSKKYSKLRKLQDSYLLNQAKLKYERAKVLQHHEELHQSLVNYSSRLELIKNTKQRSYFLSSILSNQAKILQDVKAITDLEASIADTEYCMAKEAEKLSSSTPMHSKANVTRMTDAKQHNHGEGGSNVRQPSVHSTLEETTIEDRQSDTRASPRGVANERDAHDETDHDFEHIVGVPVESSIDDLRGTERDTPTCIEDYFKKAREVFVLRERIAEFERQDEHITQPQPRHVLRRRGRGQRKNYAHWREYNVTGAQDLFDGHECLFSDSKGRVINPACANLDTGLKVLGGLIMSGHYARQIGRYGEISYDFDDPCLRSISGHLTPIVGILRDVVFRVKGTSVTFKRDFYVCDAIDNMVDIMFGSSFISDYLSPLLQRVRDGLCTFAGWFSKKKKESPEEKVEREQLELDQKEKANERERFRLQKERQRLEAVRRANAGQGQVATNNHS